MQQQSDPEAEMEVGSLAAWKSQKSCNGSAFQLETCIEDHGEGPFTVTSIEEFIGPGYSLIKFVNQHGIEVVINESLLVELEKPKT